MNICNFLGHNLDIVRIQPAIRKHGERYGIHIKERSGIEGWCNELIYCKRKGCDYWIYGNGNYLHIYPKKRRINK